MAKDDILLGSGQLFLGEIEDVETATESEIEAALEEVGHISSGAALSYSPEFYEVKGGELNQVIKTFLTNEEVTFTSGILTWNLKNIEKLVAASYSEDTEAGTRRIGIGGLKNVPMNYLRFVHTKQDTGKKLTVNIFKAQNQGGIELNFNPEEETVIDVEFKAIPAKGKADGNLVEIIDEVEAAV
ncbi:hypothetical protein [Radiobacillus sp. PE A8.2]|uniref:hypothetical protein n=1 Tax=Radiobacillus sp. PE A8.2 TaxID=3380349 RepID=UPI0038902C3E